MSEAEYISEIRVRSVISLKISKKDIFQFKMLFLEVTSKKGITALLTRASDELLSFPGIILHTNTGYPSILLSESTHVPLSSKATNGTYKGLYSFFHVL